jgi:hypothetical protein
MRFGRGAHVQSQLYSLEHDLFVMVKNQGKDVGHVTITAGAAKHLVLQLPKGRW